MGEEEGFEFEDAVQLTVSILTETVPKFLDQVLIQVASGGWEWLIGPLKKDPDDKLTLNALRLALIVAIESGNDIPKSVYPYLKQILVDAPRQKNRPTGRPRQDATLGIGLALRALQNRGMRPTRNDSSPPLSGCDAVAEAQRRLGRTPNTYEAVKAVWRVEAKVPHRGN